MSESIKYTYDVNGNLMRESAARYRKDYVYNAQNRMSFSDVQDSVLNTRNFTEYAYDAFGRRIETKEYLGDYTRNLYDGFSFDVLGKSVLQSVYSANVSAQKYRDGTGSINQPITAGRNERGSELGTRYRYIDETPLVPLTEAGKSNSSASTSSTAKTRSRPNNEYVLYSYGEPVAMTNDSGTSYFGTDILGSVRNVTDKYGTLQADYSYDAFGSPYLGNLENDIGFGYCGKVYDIGTGLYDYGFRDYSPVSARFTTIDPIRDGSNWFSYVVNDPVNYVDPFGLNASDKSGSTPTFNSGMIGQNVGGNSPTITITGFGQNDSKTSVGSSANNGFWSTVADAVNGIVGWFYENSGAISDIITGAVNKVIGRTLDIGAPVFGLLAGFGIVAGSDGAAIAWAPATALGVTATAKILGVELTEQGDVLLAQGISNLTPRTSSDGEKSSRNKPKQTGEPNSTEIERNPDGSIKRVTQFDENGNFKKEIRPNEKNQHGIDGPTTKEANYNIRPDGEVYRNRDIVRKATPEEIELLK